MVDLVRQNFKKNRKIYIDVEKKLRNELSNKIPIEHVGSTAIPNMYGKNIIDILIGASDDNEFVTIKKVLEKNGFFGSEKSYDGIYQFFASSNEETGAGDIHIHLVIKSTQRFLDFVILRDYLLTNKQEVKDYSNYKKILINDGITDRKDYKRKKSEYVSELLNRARNDKSHE